MFLGFLGHAWRSTGIIKYVTTVTINGKRLRDRPRQRWIDIVKSDLEKCAPGSKLEEYVDRDIMVSSNRNNGGSKWALEAKKKKNPES